MGVVVEKEPLEITTVTPSLEFWLRQDTAPSTGFESYLYYRVNVGGVFLTTQNHVVRYTPHIAKLDFSRLALSKLSAPIKALDDVTASDQAASRADVYVEYGEIEVDLSDGSQNITGPTNTSTVTAIFGGFNPDQEDAVDPGGDAPIILSNKPINLKVARDQADWICVAGNFNTNAFLQLWGYDSSGAVVFSSAARQLGAGHYVLYPMGGANAYQQAGGIPAEVCWMELNIGEWPGANLVTYRIEVYDCEDPPEAEFYFREPLGGFGSIRFDRVDYGATRAAATFSQWYDKRGDLSDRVGRGGIAIANAQGGQQFNLTKTLTQESLQLVDYYGGMMATKEHYIRRKKEDGTYHAVRVHILASETTPSRYPGKVDFSVSCRLAKNMNEI